MWCIGVAATIIGGHNPGYVPQDEPHPYPIVGVVVMSGIITLEAVGLYAIVRPCNLTALGNRSLLALGIFILWTVGEYLFVRGWTDQAGYWFANAFFLRSALVYLVIAIINYQVMRLLINFRTKSKPRSGYRQERGT